MGRKVGKKSIIVGVGIHENKERKRKEKKIEAKQGIQQIAAYRTRWLSALAPGPILLPSPRRANASNVSNESASSASA
jgi:hypothetical protein